MWERKGRRHCVGWGLVVGLSWLAVGAVGVRAQEAEPEGKDKSAAQPEVVVTATRGERSLLEVPYTVDTIDFAAPLHRGMDRTVGEALDALPGIHDQKTGPAQDSPYVRGLTGYHTLWLIDGIRLNNSVWRAGPNQYSATIDPFLAAKLELVRGPHSVLYGSDAVGGTIQVFSVSPPEIGDDALPVGGRVLYRYAGAERSQVARFEGWGAAGPARAMAGVSLKDYGDMEAAILGRLPKTGYNQYDGDAKVIVSPSDRLAVTAAFQRTAIRDAMRVHKTVWAVPYRGTSVGKELKRDLDQDRTLGYVRARVSDLGVLGRLEATASVQRQKERRVRVRSDGRRDVQGFEVTTYGAALQAGGEGPLGRITLGLDYYRDQVDSRRLDFNADGSFKGKKIQGPVGDDASYDLLGVYLQDEIELGEQFEAIVGVRYTFAHAVADRVEDPDTGDPISLSDQWHDVSGSVRIAGHFRFEEELELHPFIGVSQGFRAPNLSDLTRLDTARTNEIEVPSPGLDPERFVQLEVGAKGLVGPVELGASWYYTWIRDMIIRRPTADVIDGDTVVVKENVGDGWITGLELTGAIDLGAWLQGVVVRGGFSWLEGKVDTYPSSAPIKRAEWLDRLTPAQGRIEVAWTSEDERFTVSGDVRIVRAQRRLSTRDRADTSRIPAKGAHGYALFGVRASAAIVKRLRLFGAVENLTNRAYRPLGSGQNGLGTNAIAGLELRF